MEALVVLSLLGALALLAARWGCDSRESLRSREQELAALGFTWGPPSPTTTARLPGRLGRLVRRPRPGLGLVGMQSWNAHFELERATERLAEDRRAAQMWRLARQAAADPRRSYRRRLAGLLTALAAWLDPDLARNDSGRYLLRPVGGCSDACCQRPG